MPGHDPDKGKFQGSVEDADALKMPEPWRYGREQEGGKRMAPRDCIAAARDDLNQAYGSTDRRAIPIHLLSALDWMRRALEQIADQSPTQHPKEGSSGS